MGKSSFETNASKPLLVSDNKTDVGDGSFKHVQLFDELSMMEMKKSLCEGYITLLSGGASAPEQPLSKQSKKKQQQDPAVVLAFASLTTGNVIDACFGVTMASKKSQHVQQLIKDAKNALENASDADARVSAVAVYAYLTAFKTVTDMTTKIDKLNFFTKCFSEGKIRKKASQKLREDFASLEQIIAGAN